MILVRTFVRAIEALVGQFRRVEEGVADVERQLVAHRDAEAGNHVVSPGRVAVVEAVGLEARARAVQRGNASVDARSAKTDTDVRLHAFAIAVEVIDGVRHQVRHAGRAGAIRADRCRGLSALEAIRNVEFNVAVASIRPVKTAN